MASKNVLVPTQATLHKLNFSFEFYDTSSPRRYCLSAWENKKISEALERLKQVCEKNPVELRQSGSTFRFHPVIWEHTIEKSGFPDTRAKTLDAFQFALPGVNGKKARVYGALSGGTFYIVWFDIDHKIWPTFAR